MLCDDGQVTSPLYASVCLSHEDPSNTYRMGLLWGIINTCKILKLSLTNRKSTTNFRFYNLYLKFCLFSPPRNFLVFSFSFKFPLLRYYWCLLIEFLVDIRISGTAFPMSFSLMFSIFILLYRILGETLSLSFLFF